jgi:formylglycine-generating enzyme required for sulfatase activity
LYFEVLPTEVTQELYERIMNENPSTFKFATNPVEMVSWYDAIYFCNKLSVVDGLEPVYSVDGNIDTTKWNYNPHQDESIIGKINQNTSADGYRLPTVEEWQYVALGGGYYRYAGSNFIDEIAWYEKNSNDTAHPVAQKKANGYGLYDMSGNLSEWCYDTNVGDWRYAYGGSWKSNKDWCSIDKWTGTQASCRTYRIGFRIVRTVTE